MSSVTIKVLNSEASFSHPKDRYALLLETVNGVVFTRREIDIISCVLSGKTAKKIALFLAVSPKTVANHIRNIMSKLQCHSQVGIIEFIENSNEFYLIKKHYSNLLIDNLFDQLLKQIAGSHYKAFPMCQLVYPLPQKKSTFFDQLRRDVELAGVQLSLKSETIAVDNATPQPPQDPQDILLSIVSLNREDYPHYYFLVLALLQTLLGDTTLEKHILQFKQQFAKFSEAENPSASVIPAEPSSATSETDKLLTVGTFFQRSFSKTVKHPPIVLGVLVMIVVITLGFGVYQDKFIQHFNWKNLHFVLKLPQDLVISELPLPHEVTFLKRPLMMKEIDNKLNAEGSLQTAVLVGMGGAGKTTLARYYARQQKNKVIWEINAETKESLMNSFKDLAHALSKTEACRNELAELQAIKDSKERENQLICFVKKRLKLNSDWLLIYDNVEGFNIISDYFPHNPESWGAGKIIITTRDGNIKNNSHMNAHNIIYVNELLENEKIALFTSIIDGVSQQKLDLTRREKIEKFLKELCPFPLDISTAAYYIKDTLISYNEYLDRIKASNIDFEKAATTFLKENSTYTKTRYGVINLTLKKIIETHKDFKELLLLMSLVDSQSIPKALLETYKDKAIVEQFIHALRKHSLITSEENGSHFSIHRSVQEMSLNFLKEILNLEKGNPPLQKAVDTLEAYIVDVVNKEDLLRMKGLSVHCERILNHKNLLTNSMLGSIESKLGVIYFYLLGDATKAKQHLEKSLKVLNKHDEENYIKRAWALEYLGRVYVDLDNNEDAKNLLEQSISIYRKHSENNIDMARSLRHLGVVCRSLGDYERVKQLLEQSLELYRKQPRENYKGIAWVLAYLGITYRDLGDYAKSKQFFEQSLDIYNENPVENYHRISWALAWLGIVYKESGQYEKATEFLEKSLVIKTKHFSENHLNLAWVYGELANANELLGLYDKAKMFFEKSLFILRKYPNHYLDIACVLEDVGSFYRKLGDYEKAKEALQESVTLKRAHARNHLWSATVIAEFGMLYRDLGDYEKAKQLIEQSILIYQKNPSKNPIWMARTKGYLGIVYRDLGVYEKAEELLKENLSFHEEYYGKNHIETAIVLRNLAELYLLRGQIELAEDLIQQSSEIFQNSKHPERFQNFEVLSELGLKKSIDNDKQKIQNSRKQSIAYLKEALGIVKMYFPENSSHANRIRAKLTDLQIN